MKFLKSTDSTNSYFPNCLFAKLNRILLVLSNLLEQIAVVGEVHYYAKKLPFIQKGLFVADNA